MTSTRNVNTSSQNSIIKINESEPKKPALQPGWGWCCCHPVLWMLQMLHINKNHQQSATGPERRTHPSPFHFLCGHDNHMGVLLIHHLPEVHDCILKAPLGGDEDFAFIHVPSLFVRTLCCSILISLNVHSHAHLNVHSLCILADVCERFVFYTHESQHDAESTHSDVVGVDVIWTRKIWICFHDFNPRRVNWKHNSRCD